MQVCFIKIILKELNISIVIDPYFSQKGQFYKQYTVDFLSQTFIAFATATGSASVSYVEYFLKYY